ncbi:hypothetical protein JCM33374_g2230 [Metschnikowia sp. JCM 33374]|nr:hypothetical protein JCM33374_g2230 [Metschnikowia sp. JCM 33374]
MKIHFTLTTLISSAHAAALANPPETPQNMSTKLFFQPFFNRSGRIFGETQPHRTAPTMVNETQMLEISTDGFADSLKAYIYPSYFDFASFDKDSPTLAQDLQAIRQLRDKVGSVNVEISQVFSFVDYMFSKMAFTSSKLKQYSLSGGKEYTLLTYMTELNIRLLSIRTSQGTLDMSVPGQEIFCGGSGERCGLGMTTS